MLCDFLCSFRKAMKFLPDSHQIHTLRTHPPGCEEAQAIYIEDQVEKSGESWLIVLGGFHMTTIQLASQVSEIS